jgi:hypothetical protein
MFGRPFEHLPTSWQDVFFAEVHDLNGRRAALPDPVFLEQIRREFQP